jgi:hypothetical protein
VLDILHSILDASEDGRHIELASSMVRPSPLPEGLPPGRVEL